MPNHRVSIGSMREVEAHLRSAGLLLGSGLVRCGGVAAKCVQMAQWGIRLWMDDVSQPGENPVRPGVSRHLRRVRYLIGSSPEPEPVVEGVLELIGRSPADPDGK